MPVLHPTPSLQRPPVGAWRSRRGRDVKQIWREIQTTPSHRHRARLHRGGVRNALPIPGPAGVDRGPVLKVQGGGTARGNASHIRGSIQRELKRPQHQKGASKASLIVCVSDLALQFSSH